MLNDKTIGLSPADRIAVFKQKFNSFKKAKALSSTGKIWSGRPIFYLYDGPIRLYFVLDTEKGEIELFNATGNHLGAMDINWESNTEAGFPVKKDSIKTHSIKKIIR